jgi:hypothetical protein
MINKELVKPLLFNNLTRVGNTYDGGYVIPKDAINNSEFLLSLGINDDISFDLDFCKDKPTIKCIGVDFTVNKRFLKKRFYQALVKTGINALLNKEKFQIYRNKVRNIPKQSTFFTGENQFLPLEVSDTASQGKVTISELVDMCPSEASHDIFLKMDIEGAEYKVTNDILNNSNRIGYIACEYHFIAENPNRFNKMLDDLSQDFYLVHIHGNNHGAYSDELDFPDTVELTWINKALIKDMPPVSNKEYPLANLDNPCNHKKSDYKIVF